MHIRIFLINRCIVKFYKNIIFSKRKNGKISIQKYRPIGRYGIFLCFFNLISPHILRKAFSCRLRRGLFQE